VATKADRTKQAILSAAEALFSVQGFDATSLDAIGSRAGIQGTAILYHYPTKRDLYAAVLDRLFAPLTPELDELLDKDGAPAERLVAITTALVRFAEQRPAAARLILRETVARSDEAQGVIGAAGADRWERVLTVLGDADDGEAAGNPDVLWSIVLGAICFYFTAGTSLTGLPGHVRREGDARAFESVMANLTRVLCSSQGARQG